MKAAGRTNCMKMTGSSYKSPSVVWCGSFILPGICMNFFYFPERCTGSGHSPGVQKCFVGSKAGRIAGMQCPVLCSCFERI